MSSTAEFLMSTYGWSEGIARAMERTAGICECCCEDLLSSRAGYSSIVMDHLLPKSKYESEERNLENHVLSCASCNSMKGNYDPLREGEKPAEMLRSHRDELIQRVRAYLKDKIYERKLEWQAVGAVVRS